MSTKPVTGHPQPVRSGHGPATTMQMAHPEHLRSIGTLVDPPVKLPPMTTEQADQLESALTGVRREERGEVLKKFLKMP